MMSKPVPLSYFGGKNKIANWIISNFPIDYHKMHYIECFSGSAAILFNKSRSRIEYISDLNRNLFYFFKVLRDRPDDLFYQLNSSLYSENEFNLARDIYRNGGETDELKKAWATFVLSNQSFGGTFRAWGYEVTHDQSIKSNRNKIKFIHEFSKRLEFVQCFNRSADWFIDRFLEDERCLFYIDPPYPEYDQGEYTHKFTMDDFNVMLGKLYKAKFKFVLSFYEEDGMSLDLFRGDSRFLIKRRESKMSAGGENARNKGDKREECILLNYENSQKELF